MGGILQILNAPKAFIEGIHARPWSCGGELGAPEVSECPEAFERVPSTGATGRQWSPVVIKDAHAQDIAAQGGPRRPCSRGQSDHLSSILGSLSARNRSTRNACTEDWRHWSPLVASERPCAPIEARTPWHLLAPFGTDGRSWALMGAHGRPLERMSAYRAPAPLVASGRQWSSKTRTLKT